MPQTSLEGFDVDTDAIADYFDRMADGLRSNDVKLRSVSTGKDATFEDTVSFNAAFEYYTTHAYADVADPVAFVTTAALKFADEYIDPIRQGQKRHTLRYQFERDVDPGDTVSLRDASGVEFATATVDTVFEGSLFAVVDHRIVAQPTSVGDYADRLSKHYDADFDRDTIVTAIRFADVDFVDGYFGTDDAGESHD